MHRVDARHEFPFRPSNSPKRPGFQTSHPSAWHKQARDTQGRGRAPPPRERASKMRKIHAPFVWKARRGGTRGPGTRPPKKWHKGGTTCARTSDFGVHGPTSRTHRESGQLGPFGTFVPRTTNREYFFRTSREQTLEDEPSDAIVLPFRIRQTIRLSPRMVDT